MKKFVLVIFKKFFYILKKKLILQKKNIKKKIIQYSFGIDKIKKKYKFKAKNYKIIFIGNIKYVPNKNACFEFANKILPLICKIYPNIEFHIIGEISNIDKFFLKQK